MRVGFSDPGFVQGVEDPAFAAEACGIAISLLNRDLGELYGYHSPELSGVRGYTPLFAETALRSGGLPDLKHFFDIPLFDVGAPMRIPKDLARRIHDFRANIIERAFAMLRLLAIAYRLPENHFVDLVKDSEHSIIRFLHYPSIMWLADLLADIQTEARKDLPFPLQTAGGALLAKLVAHRPFPDDPKYLVGHPRRVLVERIPELLVLAVRSEEHEDMGFLTLVISLTAGLYTMLKGGTRNPIGTDLRRITFNAGDMAMEYTKYHHPDDPMMSTTHGVENSNDPWAERYSVAVFFHLRREVKLNDEHTAGSFHDMRTRLTITA